MIGLSTYSFYWQWHSTNPEPLELEGMLVKTAAWDVGLLQICDYPQIASFNDDRLRALKVYADGCGVALELGTRGVAAEHLRRYLHLARLLGVTLVRSMLTTPEHPYTPDEAVASLAEVLPEFEAAGVTLALETYEQVPTSTLVDVVQRVNSPALGICLDPANCVAALELPERTVELAAEFVRNVHVKDFMFSRQEGWIGFTLAGAPLGTGMLDLDHLLRTVRPVENRLNLIIEHWLPWQGDHAATCELEDQWTIHNLLHLRSST